MSETEIVRRSEQEREVSAARAEALRAVDALRAEVAGASSMKAVSRLAGAERNLAARLSEFASVLREARV